MLKDRRQPFFVIEVLVNYAAMMFRTRLRRRLIHMAQSQPNRSNAQNRTRGRLVRLGCADAQTLAARGDTVVHCGIFRPATIENWLQVIGPTGRLIGVEAEPCNYKRLSEYVAARQLVNVKLVNAAVWQKKSVITFLESYNPHFNKVKNSNTHSALEDRADFHERSVQAETLDTILSQCGVSRADHVTLHVSGAEYEVLGGMARVLSQPGIRVLARSILLGADGEPMYPRVAEKLRDMGLKVYHGGPEKYPPRDGCNVFAFRRL